MTSLPPADADASAHTIGGLSPDAFSSMFQAVGGLRNRRALLAMLGCMVAGVVLAGLFSMLAARLGYFMAFLGVLAMFIASATGVNAAGVLLMEQAKGTPPRGVVDAVVYGLMCIPKFIVLWLALLLVGVAVIIAMTVVYFLCKIPFLGSLLFVAVFPLSVVISGLTFCGLTLCLFLALPAIWEGATISRAIAQALAIARSRLVESMLLMAVVWLLSLAVGVIVFGVLLTGLMPMLGLSAAILGGDVVSSMAGMLHGGYAGAPYGGGGDAGGGSGHVVAAVIGGGVLWALAGSLISMVYLLGLNLVYLRVTEGMDSGAAESAMRAGFDQAKRQAVDLGQKAKDAAERAREQARIAAAAAQARAAANTVAKAAENNASTVPFVSSKATATPVASPISSQPSSPTPSPAPPEAAPEIAPFAALRAGPELLSGGHTGAVSSDPSSDRSNPFADASRATPPAGSPGPAPDIELNWTVPSHAAAPSNAPASTPAPAPAPPIVPDFDPFGTGHVFPPPFRFDSPAVQSPIVTSVAASCPNCLAPVSREDVFCGVCGHKLK